MVHTDAQHNYPQKTIIGFVATDHVLARFKITYKKSTQFISTYQELFSAGLVKPTKWPIFMTNQLLYHGTGPHRKAFPIFEALSFKFPRPIKANRHLEVGHLARGLIGFHCRRFSEHEFSAGEYNGRRYLRLISESRGHALQARIPRWLRRRLASGVEEGRLQVGLKTGFGVGFELGFYRGCIDAWNSAIRLECRKNIVQMDELLRKYPIADPENESVTDIMDSEFEDEVPSYLCHTEREVRV